MKTINIDVYEFNELSEEAKKVAIEQIRNEYYESNDFAHWAIDDCYLFEPPHEELISLFGENFYEELNKNNEYKDIPLIKNTRESIYFDTDRNSFLDCAKAMEVTNNKYFLLWLGIDTDEEAFKDIHFNIFTPNYRNADTTIEFEDFDSSFGDVVDVAKSKFDNHIQEILKRIEADIDYRFTDEAIIEDILANDYEFLVSGERF